MIYEYRCYEAAAGRLADLHRRFAEIELPLMKQLGIHVVGLWETDPGTGELQWMVRWQSKDERSRLWKAFAEDPGWLEAKRRSEIAGKLVVNVRSTLLVPTAYSPLP